MPEGNSSDNKQKLSALALQEEYLATGDPEVIGRFYEELMLLCRTTAHVKKIDIGLDDMEDIVQSICIRLFENRQPVLLSAPVSYLKNAMRFKLRHTNRYESLDSDELMNIPYTQETFLDAEAECDAMSSLLNVVRDNPDITPDVRHHVEVCIEERRNWMEYRASRITDFSQKREFTEVMKELHDAVEETM